MIRVNDDNFLIMVFFFFFLHLLVEHEPPRFGSTEGSIGSCTIWQFIAFFSTLAHQDSQRKGSDGITAVLNIY